jgi:hypothetical protein
MNCNKVEKLLLEDANVGESLSIREHLAQCGPCRTLYQQLRDIEDLSLSLGGGKGAPRDFSNQILAQTVERPPSQRKTAVAAMALLFLAGAANLWTYLAGDEALPHVEASQAVQQAVDLPTPSGFRFEDRNLQGRRFDSRPSPFIEVELQSPERGSYTVQIPSKIQIQRSQLASGAGVTRVSY